MSACQAASLDWETGTKSAAVTLPPVARSIAGICSQDGRFRPFAHFQAVA